MRPGYLIYNTGPLNPENLKRLEGLLCDHLSWEDTIYVSTHSTTDQSTDSTIVQHGEPMSFIGATCKSMGQGLLTGVEMTRRQLHYQGHPSMGDKYQNWEPGALCTAYRQLNRLERVLSRWLFLFLIPLGSWSGFSVSAAQLSLRLAHA